MPAAGKSGGTAILGGLSRWGRATRRRSPSPSPMRRRPACLTVVAPSLPGYGLSFAPNQARFGIVETAEAFAVLMTDVLGYGRFGAQGGDWGSFIVSRLGFTHPNRVAGVHLNMLPVAPERGRA